MLQGKSRTKRASARARGSGIKVPHNIHTLVCELCGGGHHEEQIILCDRCDRGCHMYCLNPPMVVVPAGDWVCPLCTAESAAASTAPKEGQEISLADFQETANSFKAGWWDRDTAVSLSSAHFLALLSHCHAVQLRGASSQPHC